MFGGLKEYLKNLQFFLYFVCYKLRVLKIKPSFYSSPEHSEEISINMSGVGGIIPKVIWVYWDDITPPHIVKLSVARIVKYNPTHKVNFLNKNSILSFLPEIENIRSDIISAHKSDFIRLSLLRKFGGIWVDATTFCNSSFDWVHNNNNYDLLAYYRHVSTIDFSYPIVESWFLAAPMENAFITSWHDEFSGIILRGSKGYFNHIKKRTDYDVISQRITNPSYLLINLAEQITSRKLPHNFLLRKSEDSAFFFQRIYQWSTIHSAIMLMVLDSPGKLPELIKLTSMERRFIDFVLHFKLLGKKSILRDLVIYK